MQPIALPKRYGPQRRLDRRTREYKSLPLARVLTFRAAPVDARTLFDRADAIDETEPAHAARLYEQALQLDPSLLDALTNLGNCHFRMYDSDRAEQCWRQRLAAEPHNAATLYNLGYLQLERGLASEALPLFERALACSPGFADAWFNMGMTLEQLGQPLRAQLAFRRYLKLDPHSTWAEIARRHVG